MPKKGTKISDKQFLEALAKNAGLFAKTAKFIEKQYGVKYSRQAVRDRANKHKEKLEQIEETNLDMAEAALLGLMMCYDDKVKLQAVKFYLKTKGKERGYIEKLLNEHTGKDGKPIEVHQITGMEIK